MNGTDLPETIRAFVAIQLPRELLDSLQTVQQRLQSGLPKDAVRWTAPEHLHLTLKFLGNISTNSLGELTMALEEACRNSAPLLLRAEGFGCFPSSSRPKVIWAGLKGGLAELEALQSRIDAAMQPWCERKEERPFRPHLTIGRVRTANPRTGRQLDEKLKAVSVSRPGEWTVRQIHLMRSQLSPNGATHTVLASVPLARPGAVQA